MGKIKIHSQVKGILIIIASTIISIIVAFIKENQYLVWSIIIILFIVEVAFLIFPSIEEEAYNSDMEYLRKRRNVHNKKDLKKITPRKYPKVGSTDNQKRESIGIGAEYNKQISIQQEGGK